MDGAPDLAAAFDFPDEHETYDEGWPPQSELPDSERVESKPSARGNGPSGDGRVQRKRVPYKRPPASLRHELALVGLSMVPGLVVVGVLFTIAPHFVARGWPLVTILWLGLFVGTLATLGAKQPSIK